MPHFRTEMCTHFCCKMLHCGIWTGAFWDLWRWFMVPAFYHDRAVCSSGIPISANRKLRLPWRHHWKAIHCRSTTHGCSCKLDSVTVATGIPRFDCHILLYRLKMHTSDNSLDIHSDGINPFTLSNHREMCSLQRFSSRGCLTWPCFDYNRLLLWRHCTCIATYSPRNATLTWSWWNRFNGGQFCFKNYMVWLLRLKWSW